ncbi:MAG: hypothetical protein KA210_06635 [Bacteroidia bacterium]|nr:hypothetical protein [Bacteroidia bacterium]
MNQYKYSLDRSSKKFTCPRCNKQTFVRYIENANGSYLDGEFGRCDRETKCAHHNLPKNSKGGFFVCCKPKPKPSFHSLDLLKKSLSGSRENNFIEFLKTLFTLEEVTEVVSKYSIGSSNHFEGATIFWQIDNLERIHAGKIMQYIPNTGKRAKSPDGKGRMNWVHSVNKTEDFTLVQCLFGLHLINETDEKTVAIVESEKTAIIMSIFKPEYTWLATGSKQGFKQSMLEPIKQFKIVVFPDKSEYEDWKQRASELNAKGFKISVSDWIEKTDLDSGSDLADAFIIESQTSKKSN